MSRDIKDLFESLQGEKIYYKPNPGNGGDALIAFATRQFFKKHNISYELIKGDEDLTNKVLIYGGGGNLVKYYHNCANFLKKHHQHAKKIILLPHTISGHAELLSSLKGNIFIICREFRSLEYITTFPNIEHVYTMDDLVIGIEKLPVKHVSNRLIFLVKPRFLLASLYKKRKPLSFFLKNRNKTKVLNAFREDVEKTMKDFPEDNIDITALVNLDYTMVNDALVEKTSIRIIGFLNKFSTINTNRLHVCIAGALLGKQVNFYDNSYHKNRSVYEFSLKNKFPNVVWKGENN